MHIKKLILLLFATLWLVPAKAWNAPVASDTEARQAASLQAEEVMHRPQWKDIGMHDVLAVTSVTSVAPPNASRLVHDTPSANAATATPRHAVYRCVAERPSDIHPYVHRGYIYLLQCLRL